MAIMSVPSEYQKVLKVALRYDYKIFLEAKRSSKAAAAVQPEMITICKKEYMDLIDNKCANIIHQTIRQSKAASLQASGINPALIHNFITKGL